MKSAALPLIALTAWEGEGFDVVFDTVGGKTLSDSIEAVGLYGQVVSILAVGNYDLSPAFLKGVSLHMVMQPLPLLTGRRREDYKMILTNIADLVDAGAIKPLIDKKSFNISEVGQAHEHLENGNTIGKVVLAGLA